MEGTFLIASWRLAILRRAFPEATIDRVGNTLVAWIPDKADKFSGTGWVAATEAEMAAKLDRG